MLVSRTLCETAYVGKLLLGQAVTQFNLNIINVFIYYDICWPKHFFFMNYVCVCL